MGGHGCDEQQQYIYINNAHFHKTSSELAEMHTLALLPATSESCQMTTHTVGDQFALQCEEESQDTALLPSSSLIPHTGRDQPFSQTSSAEEPPCPLPKGTSSNDTMPPPTFFRRIRGRAPTTETTQAQQTVCPVLDDTLVELRSLRNKAVGRELLSDFNKSPR